MPGTLLGATREKSSLNSPVRWVLPHFVDADTWRGLSCVIRLLLKTHGQGKKQRQNRNSNDLKVYLFLK